MWCVYANVHAWWYTTILPIFRKWAKQKPTDSPIKINNTIHFCTYVYAIAITSQSKIARHQNEMVKKVNCILIKSWKYFVKTNCSCVNQSFEVYTRIDDAMVAACKPKNQNIRITITVLTVQWHLNSPGSCSLLRIKPRRSSIIQSQCMFEEANKMCQFEPKRKEEIFKALGQFIESNVNDKKCKILYVANYRFALFNCRFNMLPPKNKKQSVSRKEEREKKMLTMKTDNEIHGRNDH